MEKDYIKINKQVYNKLANEYESRTINNDYEVKDDYWKNLFCKLIKKENIQVLEIGPGSGRILKLFDDLGCETTAVDISENMCKIAKKWSPNSNIIKANILDFHFEHDKFDIIYIMAVIHVFTKEDAELLMKKIQKWLKKMVI